VEVLAHEGLHLDEPEIFEALRCRVRLGPGRVHEPLAGCLIFKEARVFVVRDRGEPQDLPAELVALPEDAPVRLLVEQKQPNAVAVGPAAFLALKQTALI
jgi:hypothetical protein